MNLSATKTASPATVDLGQPIRVRRRGRTVVFLLVAIVPMMAAGTLWSLRADRQAARTDLETYPVCYEPLDRAIVVRGEVEPVQSSEIVCHVKNRSRTSTYATTIKWIIEDGSLVKRGQVLVELDESVLEEERQERMVELDVARAEWILAEENYKIIDSQNQGEITAAEVAVQLADMDLRKYLQGDYEQLHKDIQGRLMLAESGLEMWRDRVAFSGRMAKKGYLQANQARADEARLHSARFALAKVQEELRVLQQYTRARTVTELESKLMEARISLDRVQKQAKAKEAQANTDRLTKRRIYQRRVTRLREIQVQIDKCVITAPQDGLVIYNVSDSNRRSQLSIVAQGEPVYEGQLLMRLPNLSQMQVQVNLHEALVARVHGEVWAPSGFVDALRAALLVTPPTTTRLLNQVALDELRSHFHDRNRRLVAGGQPALIRFDALPERVFDGHVKQVAPLATQQDWWSDINGYQTVIAFDEPVEGLKPNMSAEVTILEDGGQGPVLTVPVQALFGSPSLGKQRKCFVWTAQGPEERTLVVGRHNEKLAEVVSGLEEGEEVILNPRALLDKRVKEEGGRRNWPSPPSSFFLQP